jgi:hypothetical protein
VSATCTSETRRSWPRDLLSEEVQLFAEAFPGLSVRFAELLGRRVSHLAGDCIPDASGELRLDVSPGLVAFVSGPWKAREEALLEWSSGAGLRLAGCAGG